MITSDEIKRRLWDGANELRGSMDAIYGVAKEWGVDGKIFEKSVDAYSITTPEVHQLLFSLSIFLM